MNGSKTWLVAGSATLLVALGATTGVAAGVLPSLGAATSVAGGGMGPGMAGMGGSADLTFATRMVPHHESAVVMAGLALERTERPEVRMLAQDIIATQTAEIEQLRAAGARLERGAAEDAGSPVGSGMAMGAGMGTDLTQVPAGPAFDRAFLEAMIPHHQMGVHMAEMAVRHGSNPQVQALAEDMVEAQTREIALMQRWLNDGYAG